MSLLTSRAVFLLGTALALQLVYSIFRRVRQATRARQLDCKSIPALPQPWFDLLGVKLVSYFDLHAKDNTLVEAFHHLFKISSHDEGRKVRTLKYHALGTKIFTYDPKNIQAILATQFEDFEIGSQRIANFMPFLGPGIVGHYLNKQWQHVLMWSI